MREQRGRRTRREVLGLGIGAGLALGLTGSAGRGWAGPVSQDQDVADPKALRERVIDMASRGIRFLRARQEQATGGWSTPAGPGISAIALAGALRSQRVAPSDAMVARALEYMDQFRRPEGGFDAEIRTNYVSSIMLMAYTEANEVFGDGRYDGLIAGTQGFLRGLQWDEGEEKTPEDVFYGGAGYGSRSRPDLSNTSFFIEALRDSGVPEDDPALQKALIFVSRTQNLDSEFNDQPWAEKVNDGGFAYTPALGGSSQAGTTANGGLRSYGSMTYAGFKSMIYAGLTEDDPRYQAALRFLQANYSVDENPGLGQQGLFYYYQVMAKALAVYGKPTLTDENGVAHDWRSELIEALAERQAEDGSWINPADRWLEGNPDLVTGYVLLALGAIRKALPTA